MEFQWEKFTFSTILPAAVEKILRKKELQLSSPKRLCRPDQHTDSRKKRPRGGGSASIRSGNGGPVKSRRVPRREEGEREGGTLTDSYSGTTGKATWRMYAKEKSVS